MVAYRREIDGLRTVAVLPVILFHAGFDAFQGGFVGVDVFFVISGYLITSLLIDDLRHDRFSIAEFYRRRARRILPALTLVVLCCLPFAWLWMVPSELRDFGRALAAVALFVSNIHFWRESDYFEPEAESNVLLHTWSLAVEEQFYIFFPLLLWALWRWRPGSLSGVLILLFLASLAGSAWGSWRMPTAAFYLIPFRAWELFAGALCALVPARGAGRAQDALAWLGLAMIGAAVLTFDDTIPFPSVTALVPVVGTALVVLYARPGTGAARILGTRPMVALGLLSYSAYLWHQPLFAFARLRFIMPPPGWVMLGLGVAAFLLAALSWRFVEQPFRRRRRDGRGDRRVLPAAGLTLGAMAAIGAVLVLGQGLPGRASAQLVPPMIDMDAVRIASYGLLRDPAAEKARREAFLRDDGRAKVLVVGDSHAKDVFNALETNRDRYGNADFHQARINVSCQDRRRPDPGPPDFPACPAAFESENAAVVAAATHILLTARWHEVRNAPHLVEAYADHFADRGKVLIVTTNTVEFSPEAPRLIRLVARDRAPGNGAWPHERSDRLFYAFRDPEAADVDAALTQLAQRHPALRLVEKAPLICDDLARRCHSVTPDGQAIYYDYGHWTLAGAQYLGKLMADMDWLDLR